MKENNNHKLYNKPLDQRESLTTLHGNANCITLQKTY